MLEGRQGRVIWTVLALAAIAGIALFLGQLFAQDEGAPPPPPDGAMEGGPGAPAAGGGALTWTETPMEEELVMTYDEFLSRTGAPRALIPDYYVKDATGAPKKYTRNQWTQLQRIYAGRREMAEVAARPAVGRPGGQIAARIANEVAVKENELRAVTELYQQGLDNFSFEVGYPQLESSAISPGVGAVPVQIGVIMKVKPNVAQRYPSLVYARLKKYDHYGLDRGVFRIVDYEGGMWNPKQVRLWNGAIAEWNGLWTQNQVRLTLYDVEGRRIAAGTQSAGHTGGICASLVYPDELNYAPMHETIIPPRDRNFEGRRWKLDYKKGWYFNFSFTIPVAQMAALDRAEVVLLGAGGIEASHSQTQAPPRVETSPTAEGESSRAAVQAGAAQAQDRVRNAIPMTGAQLPPTTFVPF